jgi:hypothetical protein
MAALDHIIDDFARSVRFGGGFGRKLFIVLEFRVHHTRSCGVEDGHSQGRPPLMEMPNPLGNESGSSKNDNWAVEFLAEMERSNE